MILKVLTVAAYCVLALVALMAWVTLCAYLIGGG